MQHKRTILTIVLFTLVLGISTFAANAQDTTTLNLWFEGQYKQAGLTFSVDPASHSKLVVNSETGFYGEYELTGSIIGVGGNGNGAVYVLTENGLFVYTVSAGVPVLQNTGLPHGNVIDDSGITFYGSRGVCYIAFEQGKDRPYMGMVEAGGPYTFAFRESAACGTVMPKEANVAFILHLMSQMGVSVDDLTAPPQVETTPEPPGN